MNKTKNKDIKIPEMKKEDLNELNEKLKRGDKAKVAKLAGISQPHLTRFFAGEDCVSEETVTKILKAISTVVKRREKRQQLNEELIKSI